MCGCPGGETDCTGTCVNLSGNDSSNCGACGHSCFAGACVTGSCQAFLVAQPPTTSSINAIATDGTNILWIDYGLMKLQQIAASGGSIITLDTTANEPPLTIGGGRALYIGGNGISLATLGMANSGMGIDHAFTNWAITNPAGNRYWKEHVQTPNDQVSDCPFGGGSCLANAGWNYTTSPLEDPVADNTNMFMVAGKSIYFESIGSGTWTAFETRSVTPANLAVAGNYVYWSEGVVVYRASEAAGGTPSSAGTISTIFATDGTNLYFPDSAGTHLLSAPANGTGAASQLTPITGCSKLAVAGKLLIWLNGATIYGLSLP
jgi:hypothetical protein